MVVQSRPAPEIVPAEISGQAIDLRGLLALRRSRLQNCIVNGNVLALWIDLRKDLRKFSGSVRSRDPLHEDTHRRAMFANRSSQRPCAPQEHAAIPCIVPGGHKHLSQSLVRLLRESLHPAHSEAFY